MHAASAEKYYPLTIVHVPDPDAGKAAREIFRLLKPMAVPAATFVRKGRAGDGGYIVSDSGLCVPDGAAYSLGINDDVSWDLDMVAMGFEVFQYDHTIEALPLEHPKFHFFKNGVADKNSDDGVFLSIPEIISRNGHVGRTDLILKMDIESAEWDVFDTVGSAILAQFSQIVVEIHRFASIDDALRRAAIINGLKQINLTHQSVHIHANNYGWLGMIGSVMLPDTLEVTYVRRANHDFVTSDKCYPTSLDTPCNPEVADYFLRPLGRIRDADALD